MKRDLAKRLNLIFWFLVACVLMGCVYVRWSSFGGYTLGSFLCSLLIHGGPCALFGFSVDEWIDDFYDKRENGKGRR